MLFGKLDRFIVKRAVIFLVLCSAADLALPEKNRWPALAGLFAGTLLSVARLVGNERLFQAFSGWNGGKAVAGSILVFTAIQLALLPLILILYMISAWLLYGFIAGILAVPLIVMINSITETLGLTKNDFE